MNNYYDDYDINLIEKILLTQDNLEKKRINKLCDLLTKKKLKRYHTENNIKDRQKSLKKYKVRGGVTCKNK